MVVDVLPCHDEVVARDGERLDVLRQVGVEAEEQLALLGVALHLVAGRGKYLVLDCAWGSQLK